MQADLAQPPSPPPGGAAPPLPRSVDTPTSSQPRPGLSQRRSTRTGPAQSQWETWDRKATDMNESWVREEDMEVLAKALSDEPDPALGDLGSPGPPGEGVEKIRAVSDFAPIKERIRRGPKRRKDVVREGWAYHVSRWPLLFLIFTIIFLEFLAYLFVRQMVNIIEFFSAWGGERGRLRVALRNAKTFEEWKSVALELDAYLGLDKWKTTPQNAYYDAPTVRRVLRALRELRDKDDAEGVAAVLHAVLRSNFAGTEGFRLYSSTYYGTKDLVQEYIDEVTRSIEYIRHAPPSLIPLDEKADFFRSVAKNLGASALCLSGGASFGYYHFGVVRALLDQDLLPRVVTGTSAGAIVAAFLCTRTNAELKTLLIPTLADRITACEDSMAVWIKRAWKTGARFDTVEWARKASFFTMGNMTFREAYERTGRVLNVSVIPYETHSPTKLLNYLTAPDCVIYTAVIASAAVPGILNPVVLLTKDKLGRLHPWEFQGKHKDGSLRVDIPLHSLHLLYNVNFSIVSQCNPHIAGFSFAPRGAVGRPVAHRKGRGWRGGFWLSAGEQFWKIEMLKWFRIIRDLELLPEMGGQNWSAVFLQKFEGTVTIFPKTRPAAQAVIDWFHILTDPDRKELERLIRVGQAVTWPKIKMIENRLKMERQIDLGRDEVRKALAQQSSQSSSERPPLIHHSSSSSTHLAPRARSRRSKSKSPFPESAGGIDIDVDGENGPFRERDVEQYSSSGLSDSSDEEGEEEGQDIEQRNGTFDSREASVASHASEARTPPAKRRQAILAKLGLGRVAGRGAGRDNADGGEGSASEERYSGGGEGEGEGDDEVRRAGGGGKGKPWTDESDWTSGGESAEGSASAMGRKGGGLRRRFSMSAMGGGGEKKGKGGRERRGTFSSEDEWR
ncbi:hypothetical protein JCM8547_002968 [Rhodosporidiobolus lusitaniae]